METDTAEEDSDCWDDDLSDDGVEGHLFSMGMTKQEKLSQEDHGAQILLLS